MGGAGGEPEPEAPSCEDVCAHIFECGAVMPADPQDVLDCVAGCAEALSPGQRTCIVTAQCGDGFAANAQACIEGGDRADQCTASCTHLARCAGIGDEPSAQCINSCIDIMTYSHRMCILELECVQATFLAGVVGCNTRHGGGPTCGEACDHVIGCQSQHLPAVPPDARIECIINCDRDGTRAQRECIVGLECGEGLAEFAASFDACFPQEAEEPAPDPVEPAPNPDEDPQ
jgi:hypothetical protein